MKVLKYKVIHISHKQGGIEYFIEDSYLNFLPPQFNQAKLCLHSHVHCRKSNRHQALSYYGNATVSGNPGLMNELNHLLKRSMETDKILAAAIKYSTGKTHTTSLSQRSGLNPGRSPLHLCLACDG